VYTSLFNYGATAQSKNAEGIETGDSYINTATLRISSPGQAPITHTVTHIDGNNNDAVNTAFEVIFTGALKLTWSLDDASKQCNTALITCGWVGLQAATLSEHSGEVGGVVLRGIELAS
jgi:hypothetical protein